MPSITPHHFTVPAVYAWRPALQLALLEAIPGESILSDALKARLKNKPEGTGALTLEAMIDACAQIVATLHRSQLDLGPHRTLATDLATLDRRLAGVERISPEVGAQLRAWCQQLAPYAQQTAVPEQVFCHGDFTFGQVLFDGTHSGLVDFDSVCMAEPALDLGHFLTYVLLAGAKVPSPAAEQIVEQTSERFLETYAAAVGIQGADTTQLRERVRVYRAYDLIRRALRSWQKVKPSRVEQAVELLEREMQSLP
jgi:aminoglycoside phosphotransferase (APT) family kinase protein